METSTTFPAMPTPGPRHVQVFAGRLFRSHDVRVFCDRIEVEDRWLGVRRRTRSVELAVGLGAFLGEDWRLVGPRRPAGALRPTTYSVDYGGRIIVAGVHPRSEAERLVEAIDAVARPGRG